MYKENKIGRSINTQYLRIMIYNLVEASNEAWKYSHLISGEKKKQKLFKNKISYLGDVDFMFFFFISYPIMYFSIMFHKNL